MIQSKGFTSCIHWMWLIPSMEAFLRAAQTLKFGLLAWESCKTVYLIGCCQSHPQWLSGLCGAWKKSLLNASKGIERRGWFWLESWENRVRTVSLEGLIALILTFLYNLEDWLPGSGTFTLPKVYKEQGWHQAIYKKSLKKRLQQYFMGYNHLKEGEVVENLESGMSVGPENTK